MRRVNRGATVCGNRTSSPECYAATLDFSALDLRDDERAAVEHALERGTALLRGRVVHGTLAGPPPSVDLDVVSVTEVWRRYGRKQASGTVFRVEDNGVRCVRAPCFSLHAWALNTTKQRGVSSLDLAASGASSAAVGRARAALAGTGVLVEGRIVAGRPPGDRTLRAAAFWLRAA